MQFFFDGSCQAVVAITGKVACHDDGDLFGFGFGFGFGFKFCFIWLYNARELLLTRINKNQNPIYIPLKTSL